MTIVRTSARTVAARDLTEALGRLGGANGERGPGPMPLARLLRDAPNQEGARRALREWNRIVTLATPSEQEVSEVKQRYQWLAELRPLPSWEARHLEQQRRWRSLLFPGVYHLTLSWIRDDEVAWRRWQWVEKVFANAQRALWAYMLNDVDCEERVQVIRASSRSPLGIDFVINEFDRNPAAAGRTELSELAVRIASLDRDEQNRIGGIAREVAALRERAMSTEFREEVVRRELGSRISDRKNLYQEVISRELAVRILNSHSVTVSNIRREIANRLSSIDQSESEAPHSTNGDRGPLATD